MEYLFLTEKARLTFHKFLKFEVSSVDKTSILTLARLDALATKAVDNLVNSIANIEQILHNKNENLEVPGHASVYGNIVRDSKIKTKGSCILQVSAEKVETILPLASFQLF